MKRALFPFVPFALAAIACAQSASIQARQVLSVDQLIDATLASYTKAGSYRDTGVALTLEHEKGKWREAARIEFTTTFKRPSSLLMELHEKSPGHEERSLLWSDGKSHRWWSSFDKKTRNEDSLELALVALSGNSSGVSETVPALLMPYDDVKPVFGTMRRLKLLPPEAVDGELCHRLEGAVEEGTTLTVWIDQRTYMIRQILEENVVEGERWQTLIVFKPLLNAPVEAADLRFAPPR
jgi:outer membrane lipoprotein-sorting protein